MEIPSKKDIEDAYQRIRPYISHTPLITSRYIDKISSASVIFKCQNLQKTGSFKVRGAANKILQLNNAKGLCTHSSGNHAQAVAYMAKQLGIPSCIVMPADTPQVKKNAVKGYGATIVESGPTVREQQQASSRQTVNRQAQFVHPYNDLQIITGAASIAYQVYQEKQFDYIVVPVGGGGLCSGTLLATHHFTPKTIVIGVQPFLARDAKDSLASGKIEPQYPPKTLAEGVRTSIGTVTFQVMKRFLGDIILVSEEEMISAAQMFVERLKLVVQLSGALVLAAILKDPRFRGKRVCAIISGGNMNLSELFSPHRARL